MGWGDEIMASGEARVVHERDGRKVLIAGVHGPRAHEAWQGVSFIAQPGESGVHSSINNGPNMRPYVQSKSDTHWTWKRYRPIPGTLALSARDLAFAKDLPRPYVLIEPNIKPRKESANKTWPFERWQQLVDTVNLPWLQCYGGHGERLRGVRVIETPDFRAAAAALLFASLYVGPEGGLHHAAAAFQLPAVVLFGGFISPEVTGYASHTNIYTGQGLGCGARSACDCCIAAMHRITVEQVAQATIQQWQQVNEGKAA